MLSLSQNEQHRNIEENEDEFRLYGELVHNSNRNTKVGNKRASFFPFAILPMGFRVQFAFFCTVSSVTMKTEQFIFIALC